MDKFFNTDNKFFNIVSRIVDTFVLTFLWFLCSLPILTIGTSGAAFYYAFQKSVREKRGYAWQNFFRSFKSNFKQTVIVWLIMLALYGILALDYLILSALAEEVAMAKTLINIIMIILMLVTLWCLYLFPYIARFENKTGVILKNCLLMAVINLPWSLAILLSFLGAISLFIACVTKISPLFVTCIPGGYMLVANLILERVFRKYLSPEDLEKLQQMEEEQK